MHIPNGQDERLKEMGVFINERSAYTLHWMRVACLWCMASRDGAPPKACGRLRSASLLLMCGLCMNVVADGLLMVGCGWNVF